MQPTITVRCSECGATREFPSDMAGQRLRCRNCAAELLVQSAPTAAEPAADEDVPADAKAANSADAEADAVNSPDAESEIVISTDVPQPRTSLPPFRRLTPFCMGMFGVDLAVCGCYLLVALLLFLLADSSSQSAMPLLVALLCGALVGVVANVLCFAGSKAGLVLGGVSLAVVAVSLVMHVLAYTAVQANPLQLGSAHPFADLFIMVAVVTARILYNSLYYLALREFAGILRDRRAAARAWRQR